MNYDIQYQDEEGEMHTKTVRDMPNAGAAFAEVLKGHPERVLLRGQCHSTIAGSQLWIDYYPPKVQRMPLKRHKSRDIQPEMPI